MWSSNRLLLCKLAGKFGYIVAWWKVGSAMLFGNLNFLGARVSQCYYWKHLTRQYRVSCVNLACYAAQRHWVMRFIYGLWSMDCPENITSICITCLKHWDDGVGLRCHIKVSCPPNATSVTESLTFYNTQTTNELLGLNIDKALHKFLDRSS